MLELLRIKNLALVEEMTLDFSDGINVLTGETGAGKSFIMKALNFVLGEKLPTSIIRQGAEKAQVEAAFSYGGKELILRRELNENGRSRLYINDSLSSQETVRELKEELISHTSQHAQQNLLNPNFQAALLDDLLENEPLVKEKESLINHFKELEAKLEVLLEKRKELIEKRELLEMQAAEIDKVNPKDGEEEKLEDIRAKARQHDSEKQMYDRLSSLLYGESAPGLLQQINEFERILEQAQKNSPERKFNSESVLEFRVLADNLFRFLKNASASGSKFDLDAIEERLFELAQLKRKLKRSFPEILALKNEIEESLSFLDACALDISHLEKEKKITGEKIKTVISKLLPLRQKASRDFAEKLECELRDLGFPKDVKVVPDFIAIEVLPGIMDHKGRILWAPNPGQAPQPLDKIASGGELSRFLLSLVTLRKANQDITYIFDEVDTGVGGLTLNMLGEKLENLGKSRQIILITHWPQLAVRAERHFLIKKNVRDGQTYTESRELKGDAITEELERMGGGKNSHFLISQAKKK